MRVAVDVSSLAVRHTGVSLFLKGLLDGLARTAAEGDELILFPKRVREGLASASRARGAGEGPSWLRALAGNASVQLLQLWQKAGAPTIDRWVDADVIHVSDIVPLPTSGPRITATVYDLTPALFPRLYPKGLVRLHEQRNRWIAERADRIFAISETTRQDVVKLLHVGPERVIVVPGAAGPDFANPGAAALGRARLRYRLMRPYWLHLGTLEARKNLPALAEAFARFSAGRAEPWDLVLAGTDGPGADAIRREVVSHAGDRARLLGYVPREDAAALAAGAFGMVFPTLYEGFGLPAVEAMRAGAPLLCSDVPALRETAGDAAVFFDPHRPEDIARAMEEVAGDSALRKALRERGRARAARYSWEKSARTAWAAWRSLAEAR